MGLFSALLGSGFFLYFIVLQVICAVHCVRTGRNMSWLFIILMFSGIGCLLYFFVEMLPDLRQSRRLKKANSAISGLLDPDRGLRQEGANLAFSGNVENTCNYAEQLMHKGKYADAIGIYQGARKGMFLYDPVLLIGLARACHAGGRHAEAVTALEELAEHNPNYMSSDTRLLYAMALEADGRPEQALREYASWAEAYPGPEAKCRYAQLLKKQGEQEKALSLFRDIKLYAVNAPKHYLRQHKEWIDMALRECKAAEQKAG